MRSILAITATTFILSIAACEAPRSQAPREESVGKTSQALVALGQPCASDAQCTTAGTTDGAGHCVDTVCCNSACGGGARDNQACSNVYGTVTGMTPGQCMTLPNGAPCADLEPGAYCRFRTTTVTGGSCPAPGPAVQLQACYACSNSTTCPVARPVCDSSGVIVPKPLDTYFMLDHSGSMGSDCALGSGGTSKWCYATNALAKYFQSPTTTGNRAALQYFTLPNNSCSNGSPHHIPAVNLTTLPVASNSALVQNLAAEGPTWFGGTDIESAARGIVRFTRDNVAANRTMTGVLITDGDPNGCDEDPADLAKILSDHLNATGIRTFVIGMTGATASRLDILAKGGGAPAHGPEFCIPPATSCYYYSVGNGDPAAFDAALGAIQQAAGAGCEACATNHGGGANACPTTGAPICKSGECVGCETNQDCITFNPTTPVCNTATNTCQQCSTNNDCPATAPFCTGGACVPCDGDHGSGSPHACPTPGAPACVTTGPDTGSCVPCTTSAHCPDATPVCNPQHQCVPCTGNAGSGGAADCPTNEPVCITTGPGTGTCVECTPTQPGACTGGTPVCNPANNTCVECTDGSQCPSGVCDPTTNTCTTPCSTNADCTAPKPICNGGICVECNSNTDCESTEICNPTTHTCVSNDDAGVDAGPKDAGNEGGIDAGSGDGGRDSGTTADSGTPNPDDQSLTDEFGIEGGGCNCKVGTNAPVSSSTQMLAALGAIAAFGLRRRRSAR